MTFAALPSENAAVVATIDPDVLTAAAHSSDYVDMSEFESLLCVVMAGTLGASATFDCKLQQATTAAGAGAKDISGKAITQLTQASPDDSDKVALINLRGEELDVANGFRYVKAVLTVATASCDGGAVLLGFGARNGPASDDDLADVTQIVA